MSFYVIASLLIARYKKDKKMNEVAKQKFQDLSQSLTSILVYAVLCMETLLLVILCMYYYALV